MSFLLCGNFSLNFNINKIFCCKRKAKKKDKNAQEENFKINRLKKIEKSSIFSDPDLIILIVLINAENNVISITKNQDNSVYMYDSKTDNIKNFIGTKIHILIKKIHDKVKTTKKTYGCCINYENYDYSLVGIPVKDNDTYLSTLIVKKIYIDIHDNKSLSVSSL
jgi:hypothetical protein